MREGGSFHGVTVSNGIGRERLGQLYLEATRRLQKDTGYSFAQFRDLLMETARTTFNDNNAVETVRNSFRAVGL